MKQPQRVSHLYAILALVAACVLWATSFASVKICGRILSIGAGLERDAPFGCLLLTAVRFSAALPLVMIFWKPARRFLPRRGEYGALLRVAVPMAIGFLVQAAGLASVPATLSGFVTGLCVCFTPAFEWILLGRRPTWRLSLGVALALGGAALMTLTGEGEEWGLSWGVVLTFLCVLAYTVQIVYTGLSSERLGPARLTTGSFAITALCGWAVALVMSPASIPGALRAAAIGEECGRFWLYFSILVVCATIGAMIIMNVFQRYVRPSEAAVVYTSVPVFTGVFAVAVLGWGEFPGSWGLAGAGLMLAANLLVALKKRRRSGAAPGTPVVPDVREEEEAPPASREKR